MPVLINRLKRSLVIFI